MVCAVLSISAAVQADEAKSDKLRHVVLFKYKDGTTPEQIKTINDAFRALPSKIPQVVRFEWGTDESPEHMAQGFTHCYFLTFRDKAGRDTYLATCAQGIRQAARSALGQSAGDRLRAERLRRQPGLIARDSVLRGSQKNPCRFGK